LLEATLAERDAKLAEREARIAELAELVSKQAAQIEQLTELPAGACWPDGETWLVPAESGGGKSTLALALFAAGARWLSDDALLLCARGTEVEAIGWARMIRMTSRTATAFPALAPLLTRCPEGSARDFEIDPRSAFPALGQASASSPLTLLFPHNAGTASSTVVPLYRAEAFGRVLHACAWVAAEHLPGRQQQLDLLARLVDRARAFEVAVGSRILTDPSAAVAELQLQLR
jgi:hypothetical protein